MTEWVAGRQWHPKLLLVRALSSPQHAQSCCGMSNPFLPVLPRSSNNAPRIYIPRRSLLITPRRMHRHTPDLSLKFSANASAGA